MNIQFSEKHPVILDSSHRLSILLAKKHHKDLAHPGYKRTLAELRRKYWIVKGNRLCQKISKECIECRKIRGKTGEQLMANLPNFRVGPYTPAFYYTAVDYFGPLNIIYSRNATIDGYGCVFTCLTVYAVHVELVCDASTQSFLFLAFRRFIAMRGHARFVISDNGTNFVGAQKFF